MNFRAPLLASVAAVLLVAPGVFAEDTWTVFTSKEGRFSIATPGPLAHRTQTVTTKGGKEVRNLFNFISGDHTYLIGYTDFLQGLHEPSPDELVKNAIEGVTGPVKGEPEQHPVKVSGYDGLAVVITTEEKVFAVHVVRVGRRVYQVIVGRRGPKLTDEDQRFLDSFKITAPPTARDRKPVKRS